MAQNRGNDQGGSMSVQEAGRMGGETRREQLGEERYKELGKMGGQERADDEDVKSGELGRQGAEARWAGNGKGSGRNSDSGGGRS